MKLKITYSDLRIDPVKITDVVQVVNTNDRFLTITYKNHDRCQLCDYKVDLTKAYISILNS